VLLGADRSVDPGVHTVVAFAPGYGQKEAKVTVREREPSVKVVTIALQPTGGVVYVPSGPGTQVVPAPPQQQPAVVVVNAPPPPPPGPPPPPPPPLVLESRLGFLAGVRAGYDVMTGGLLPSGGPNSAGSVSLNQAFSNAVSFGLQAGIRFQRRLYLGVIYDHAWGGAGSSSTSLADYYTTSGFTSANGSSSTQVSTNGNMIGIDGGYISNPDGLGIVLDIALAYRAIGLSSANNTFSASYNGAELIVGGGLWIKAGQYIRLVPRVDIALGTFGSQSIKCNGDPGLCMNSVGGDPGTSVPSAPIHAIVFLGVGGYFNLDFARRM
jgi:hypothetical protein